MSENRGERVQEENDELIDIEIGINYFLKRKNQLVTLR